jgi:hypothetical protein
VVAAAELPLHCWHEQHANPDRSPGLIGYSRTRHPNPSVRFFEKKQTWKTDRDGDIRMKGAKVSMEKARKEGLCFECGTTGHQARNCRKRQAGSRNNKDVRIRMVRTESEERSETGTLEEEDPVSTAETKMLENLTLGDLDTEPSTDEESKEEPTGFGREVRL